MDFLGWKHFFDHMILRNSTKKRLVRNIKNNSCNSATLNSYFGLLGYGNTYNVKREIITSLFLNL